MEAPSPPMTLGSKILGIFLIAFGLPLLTLVLVGFAGSLDSWIGGDNHRPLLENQMKNLLLVIAVSAALVGCTGKEVRPPSPRPEKQAAADVLRAKPRGAGLQRVSWPERQGRGAGHPKPRSAGRAPISPPPSKTIGKESVHMPRCRTWPPG